MHAYKAILLTKIQKRTAANNVIPVEITKIGYCSQRELVTIADAAFPSSFSVGSLLKIAIYLESSNGTITYSLLSTSPSISNESLNIGSARLVPATMASSASCLLYFIELEFLESLSQLTFVMPCLPEQFPQQDVIA